MEEELENEKGDENLTVEEKKNDYSCEGVVDVLGMSEWNKRKATTHSSLPTIRSLYELQQLQNARIMCREVVAKSPWFGFVFRLLLSLICIY